jgi:hypothetical protein
VATIDDLTTRDVEIATTISFAPKKKKRKEKECSTRCYITSGSIEEQHCLDKNNHWYNCC